MRLILSCCSIAILLGLFMSCSTRDDRDEIRARAGEPDEIRTLGKDPFWREQWFYYSAGVGYEFRRTAGCGSDREVYLYTPFTFIPDTSRASGAEQPLPPPRGTAAETRIPSSRDILAPHE